MPRQPGRGGRRGLGNNYTEVLKEKKVGNATMTEMMAAISQRTNLEIVSFTA